jgi:serine/threonine protein kinase
MNVDHGQVIGQYTISRRIGSGGMAVVYEAEHNKLGRSVALKMMHAGFQDDADLLERFNREARIVARLEHPNIVPIYDFDDHNGVPYLIMKRIDGRTLKWHMRKRALPLEEIDLICTAVADALTFAHERGVLHRDVKPANVILAEDGTPYLTDFGLARVLSQGESSLSAGMIVGTPHYLSPEQASGRGEVGPAADQYALGVMMYEMVVGQVPFAGDTTHTIVHDHIYTEPPIPSLVNPEIPTEVEVVLLRALEKDPADRYESAQALMEAFHTAIAASGLTSLSEERSEIAARSMALLKKERVPAAPTGETGVQAPVRKETTEAELDFGKMMQGVDRMLQEVTLIPDSLGSEIGEAFSRARRSVKRKIQADTTPYEPPTESELERQIRKRVEQRINARNGWWGHLVAFLIVGTLLTVATAIAGNITESSLMGEVTAGNMTQLEATMAITWATQPWYLTFMLFWFGGLMAHRMSVNNLSAKREDKRRKHMLRHLNARYGPNWQSIITQGQYNSAETIATKRYQDITDFWKHVWTFIFINIGLVAAWAMVAAGLEATVNLMVLDDPEGARIVQDIASTPMVLMVTLVWGMGLFVHAVRTLFGRRRSLESELEQERELTRSRLTPHPDKRKRDDEYEYEYNYRYRDDSHLADSDPRPVRLNDDGELTNSTVEAWRDS